MRKVFALVFFLLLGISVSGHGDEPWQKYRTPHFIIFYRQIPDDFVKSVEQTAERYFEEINRDLGFSRWAAGTSDQRITIYIYQDQNDYINSAKQEDWSHGVAYFKEKTIRTFPSAYGFFDSVLPHELGHIIFREFVGPDIVLPLWFDEGVAMFQERAKRWGAHKVVKQAIASGDFISLDDLTLMRLSEKTDRKTIDLFYAESASVVYFMIEELGENRFVSFCRKLKDGEAFPAALADAYGRFRNVKGLNDAWVDYLQGQ